MLHVRLHAWHLACPMEINDQLLLTWEPAPGKSLYLHGRSGSRFSAQVGNSTDGGFAWMIFHAEMRHVLWGGSAPTVQAAQGAAQEWLYQNARPEPGEQNRHASAPAAERDAERDVRPGI